MKRSAIILSLCILLIYLTAPLVMAQEAAAQTCEQQNEQNTRDIAAYTACLKEEVVTTPDNPQTTDINEEVKRKNTHDDCKDKLTLLGHYNLDRSFSTYDTIAAWDTKNCCLAAMGAAATGDKPYGRHTKSTGLFAQFDYCKSVEDMPKDITIGEQTIKRWASASSVSIKDGKISIAKDKHRSCRWRYTNSVRGWHE